MNDNKIIIYDFDGTLTPFPIANFKILESCGIDGGGTKLINVRAKELAQEENIGIYDAIYKLFIEVLHEKGVVLNDDNIALGSDEVIYNNGVGDYLKYVYEKGIKNYIVSSGIKVFLERTKYSEYFAEIFATTFKYDENGEAYTVDYLMSDVKKVDAIKEVLRLNNISDDDCSRIIYIGDGFTDVNAMEYVKNNGGISIFVYNDEEINESYHFMEKGYVNFCAYADYSLDGELVNYIKNVCNLD